MLDLFDDLEDFWTWLRSSSVAELLSSQANPVELDLDRILLAGESAGGLLGMSLALAHVDEVRAAIVAYPPADTGHPCFKEDKPYPMMGISVPDSAVKDHIASMKEGAIVSSAPPPERVDLVLCAIQHGHVPEMFDRGTENSPRRELLYPMEKLDQPEVRIPRGGIAIIQGLQDDMVPPEVPQSFVDKARRVLKGKPEGDRIFLSLQEGGHIFDSLVPLDTEWLQECIKVAVETWLE